MGLLHGSSSFFKPGPPCPLGQAPKNIVDFLHINSVGKILDVGGGLGAYSQALIDLGHDVTMAEIDCECITSAQKAGIPCVNMNSTGWADLENQFETIIMVEVLEHIEDFKTFLENAIKSAKKKLLMTIPCNENFENFFKFGLTYNHIAVSDHLHHFTEAEIRSVFSSFQCSINIEKANYLYPDAFLSLLITTAKNYSLEKFAYLPLRTLRKVGLLKPRFPSKMYITVEKL